MEFRSDFIWGAATAAYQIEGAAYEDGKGKSIWDVFCKIPGRVFEGHTGEIACDHYHRFKEDVELMREIGIKAYRFSISWPRVLPKGTGEVNEAGIAFYEELIDALLAADIIPYITLYHWDLPHALYCRGGWLNPDSPQWFAEYARLVGDRLGKKAKRFMTFNEPQIFIGHGFVSGEHAPGMPHGRADVLRMAHNVLLAHGQGVKALRKAVPDSQIGIAFAGKTFIPASDADIEAARRATFHVDAADWAYSIAWWSDPIFLGQYPKQAMDIFAEDMPEIGEGDMEIIRQPLDFQGVNIYNSATVRADEGGFSPVPLTVGYRKTAFGWPVTPQSMRWAPVFLYERYKLPVFITENGISCADGVSADGKVHDPARVDFLAGYLAGLEEAAKYADIRGYFQWSLLDNFEWGRGYDERFGLIYVDYATQERILKDSAYWYKNVIEKGLAAR